jgi:hypothetical protein
MVQTSIGETKPTFFFFTIFIFTYMCIHYLPPQNTPLFRQNLLCPLVLWFCGRENMRDNKKNIVLLLVCNKDIYTERFLVLLPCICVLQPILVHLYQTSSLLPSPFLIVASATLRFLYSLLYNEHINHIQVLSFLLIRYSSCARSPFSVWTISNNISVFAKLTLWLYSLVQIPNTEIWVKRSTWRLSTPPGLT